MILKVYRPSLLDVQYLENHCFIYISCRLVISGKKTNLVLVTPSRPESEVLVLLFSFDHLSVAGTGPDL